MKVIEIEDIINSLRELNQFASKQDYNISSRINKTVMHIESILQQELNKLKTENIDLNGPKIMLITNEDVKISGNDIVTLTNNALSDLISKGFHVLDYNVMNIYDLERSYSYIKYTT